jgi:coproporphyrinogen III oxidase-like Fe-S oxidoreductase
MTLRLTEGLDLDLYEMRWSVRPDAAKITALGEQGLVRLKGARLAATPEGRLLLNRVIEELVC